MTHVGLHTYQVITVKFQLLKLQNKFSNKHQQGI